MGVCLQWIGWKCMGFGLILTIFIILICFDSFCLDLS
jgi:hypothetical protein